MSVTLAALAVMAQDKNMLLQMGRSTTDGDAVASVTFETEYASTPEVFIQPRGTTDTIPVMAKVTALTATGFSIKTHKISGGALADAANQAFSWIAMGARA